jgi:hypothetical protein
MRPGVHEGLSAQGDDRHFLQELLVLVGGFEDQQAGTFDGAHLLLLRGYVADELKIYRSPSVHGSPLPGLSRTGRWPSLTDVLVPNGSVGVT